MFCGLFVILDIFYIKKYIKKYMFLFYNDYIMILLYVVIDLFTSCKYSYNPVNTLINVSESL